MASATNNLAYHMQWPSTKPTAFERPVYRNPWLSTSEVPAYRIPWAPRIKYPANTTRRLSGETPVHSLQWFLTHGNPATAKMTPGSIYYLPHADRLSAEQRRTTARCLHPGIFNHAVLIVSPCRADHTVDFFIITSLGGKTADEYTRNPFDRASLIPLFPNEPHPDNGSLVYLNTDWGLPKKSYIRTGQRFTVRSDVLEPLFDEHTGRQFQLRAQDLPAITGMSPSSPFQLLTPPGSPCSSHSRSSSMTSISSLSTSLSSMELTGHRTRYSRGELLSLRPAAISQPAIVACLRTEDFDLLKAA
ncbi:MAG: hypothetical protein LQ346_004656 [Caloplaca aetnensis]|nr:MAG: hypothetical protein LQ346_004656 [Caloplaca aetnensis]